MPAALKPEVLLLIDKSASMNTPSTPDCTGACATRALDLKIALNETLAGGLAAMRLSLAFFPDSTVPPSFRPAGCAPTRNIAVWLPSRGISDTDTAGLANVTNEVNRQIQSLGIDIPISGGSPMADSLRFVGTVPQLFDLTDARADVIVLITDGLPNCSSSNMLTCASTPPPALDKCTLNPVPNPRMLNNCLGEYCAAGYVDRSGTVQALSELRSRGISTLVIGLGTDVAASSQVVEALDAMAAAGGLPRRCPNGTNAECGAGGTCTMSGACSRQFFAASSADELKQILSALPALITPTAGGSAGGGSAGGGSAGGGSAGGGSAGGGSAGGGSAGGGSAGGGTPTAGGSANACNATNCPSGCCSGNVCELGTSNSLCGGGGNACAVCGPGTTCRGSACLPNPPSCNTRNCPNGCCNGSTCETGTSSAACGRGGGACSACPGGLTCQSGACAPVNPGNCGPQSCAGCCSNGQCRPGGDMQACGRGGGVCQVCFSGGSSLCLGGVCLSSTPANGGGDGGTGSPCTQASHCAVGFPPVGPFPVETAACILGDLPDGGVTPWVSGYCSSTCALGQCAGNGTCVGERSAGSITYNCYSPCSQPGQGRSSCRVGYVCEQLYNVTDGGAEIPIAGGGYCSPDCRNVGARCATGLACNSLGYCS
jgi:hypothetical protein